MSRSTGGQGCVRRVGLAAAGGQYLGRIVPDTARPCRLEVGPRSLVLLQDVQIGLDVQMVAQVVRLLVEGLVGLAGEQGAWAASAGVAAGAAAATAVGAAAHRRQRGYGAAVAGGVVYAAVRALGAAALQVQLGVVRVRVRLAGVRGGAQDLGPLVGLLGQVVLVPEPIVLVVVGNVGGVAGDIAAGRVNGLLVAGSGW